MKDSSTEQKAGDALPIGVSRTLFRKLRAAALVQFSAECNEEHMRLLADGPQAAVYQDRHTAAAMALTFCLRPHAVKEHPWAKQFEAVFLALRLEVERSELDAVVRSIPASEVGNERLRTIDFAVSIFVQHDRALDGKPLVPGRKAKKRKLVAKPIKESPQRNIRLLERIFPTNPDWLSLPRSSAADTLGMHPDVPAGAPERAPSLPLGSFSDLALLLEPCHVAACLLVYLVSQLAELNLARLHEGLWNGLTLSQRDGLAEDYREIAKALSSRLRRLLAGGTKLRHQYPWFNVAKKEDLTIIRLLLDEWRPGMEPTGLERRVGLLCVKDDQDLPGLRRRLFDDIVLLHRPLGPPRRGYVTEQARKRDELIDDVWANHGLPRRIPLRAADG
jgi:hypothetical protein